MRFSPALQLTLALSLFGYATRGGEPRAEFLGSFNWTMQQPWFGGLSGIELSGNGLEMIAITDRARLMTARISRENGLIRAVDVHPSARLKAQSGIELIGETVDSEGLAVSASGDIFISFERIHRVSNYPSSENPAQGLHRAQAFRDLPRNGGFEALALDSLGRLYTLPENDFGADDSIPVYRWQDGQWSQPFSLPGDSSFRPVGADFGPDGRFYLLERNFSVFGFRSRVRSWILTETEGRDEQLLVESARRTHDNLEGLAVWRDTSGRIRLTLVSDDNFLFLQKTELVEYALPE